MPSKSWTGSPAAWPFLLMIAVGLIVPSTGSHSFLNPKSLTLIPALGCTFLHAITRSYLRESQIFLFLAVLSLGILLGWSLLIFSAVHPFDTMHSPIDQLKVFVITIATATMLIYWYLSGAVSYPLLIKTVLWANMLFSIAKSAFVAALLLGFVKLEMLLEMGSATMTTSMGAGLTRLQMSTDIPTPFLLFFALMSARLGIKLPKGFLFVYTLVSIAAIFFSYSRYLWAVGAVGYVISVWAKATPARLLRQVGVCICLGAAMGGVLGFEAMENMVAKRFLSEETHTSDYARVEQVDALMDTFESAPFLGSGVGSWGDGCIRDRCNPHLYEVQWVAFLMQFGVLGMIPIAVILGGIGLSFLRNPLTKDKVAVLLMYCLWLLSGFTNPFMISLNSGTLYGLFLVTAWWLTPARLTCTTKKPEGLCESSSQHPSFLR